MNYAEIAIIGLLIVNLLMIYLTGLAISNLINQNALQLSEDLAKLLTEQLPEAIQEAAETLGDMPQTNPIQQMAVEWMKSMMNNNTLTATVTDLTRDEAGKFAKLENND
tara:strand:+ start:1101 stop:1427 length:327 start_codon:yes stop_codon:yes gene_type:complete